MPAVQSFPKPNQPAADALSKVHGPHSAPAALPLGSLSVHPSLACQSSLLTHPPAPGPYCRTELSWTTMRQQAYYLACQRATQQYGHVNRQKKRSVMRRPTPNETAPHPPHHNT